MKQTYETGLAGEETAEHFLEGKGMVCLLRRYRNKCGEIDLVMKDRETIVFVEVKTRKKAGPGQRGDKMASGRDAGGHTFADQNRTDQRVETKRDCGLKRNGFDRMEPEA